MPTELRDRLMRLRDKRPRPARDDKALADWNALAVIGLARAGALLVKPEWIKLAESIFARCLTLFQVSAYGSSSRLGHSWRGDVLVKPGFAGDHAAMALAAVALFEASQNPDHLRRARGWLDELQAKYTTASGMLATIADDATPLAARLAPTEDDATPNPHALAFEATARLAALTEDARLRARLDEGFAAVASAVAAAPTAHCGLLNAFDLAVSLKEALVAGEGEGARALFEAARAAPWLGRTLRRLGPATKIGDAHVAAGQIRTAGKDGAVFVCSDGTCGPPLREPHEVAAALS